MCLPHRCIAMSAARTRRERCLQHLFYCCLTSQFTWRVHLLRVYEPLPSNGCFSTFTVLSLRKYATIFWEVITSTILSKKLYIYSYMCPIPNGFRGRAMDVIACIKGRQDAPQTSNTPCLHTSCKVRWSWRWNFRKCIILRKLYQLVTWTINAVCNISFSSAFFNYAVK
jgi:hypothetical protein